MENFPVTFIWPQFLWLLLALPLLVLLYVWLLRRKKKTALRYASLSIVREAMGKSQTIRRHIPPALFLLAFAAMLLAASRPLTVITLPSQQQTIILAMDVSGSMRATDVKPNRLVASQNAAKAFLAELPRHVRVGIVAFAGSASVVQAPTLSREDLAAAIDRFQLQRATAIGSAIVVSLAEIFPNAGIDLAAMTYGNRPRGVAIDQAPKEGKKEFTPVAPGSYGSAAIILLTDGQRTTGVDTIEAAKMAADRGVRVYTVGIGTVDGETIGFEGWSMHPGRLLLRRHRGKPEEGLRDAEFAPDGREARDRSVGASRAGRGGIGVGVRRPVGAVVQPDSLITPPSGRSSAYRVPARM